MKPGGVQTIGVMVTSPGLVVPMTDPPWKVNGGFPPLYELAVRTTDEDRG